VLPEKKYFDDETAWKYGDTTPDPLAPPAQRRPILQVGSQGADVAYLQKTLGIKVDGDFGGVTERAVEEFQKQHGLVVDGIVGPVTWDAVLAG
jgi:peptidoglycan hydrolase-like protein with peptidoglycan-binding domain